MTSPWLAGIGAGLQSFGGSLEAEKDRKEKEAAALAQAQALERMRQSDKAQWNVLPQAVDLKDGKGPGLVERSSVTGEVRRVRLPGDVPAPFPGTTSPPTDAAAGGPIAAPPGGGNADLAMARLTGAVAPPSGPSADAGPGAVPTPQAPSGPPPVSGSISGQGAPIARPIVPTGPSPAVSQLTGASPAAPSAVPRPVSPVVPSGVATFAPKVVPPKAPLLGTQPYVDAEVTKAAALARQKLADDSTSAVRMAPIIATADSLKAAKTRQAEQAAGPVNAADMKIVGKDADGNDVVQFIDPRTHQLSNPQILGVTPGSGSMGGGQSLSPDMKSKMVSQAKLDNQTMKRIEARVLAGDLKFGTAAGLAGAASAAHGGVLNEGLGVLGNAAAGMIDPDIQNYFVAQQSYGRIMGNLQSKRYTDHQADIERRISGMQGNDLKNTIEYKQQLRDASLEDPVLVKKTLGGGRSSGGNPSPSLPPISQAEYGALLKQGFTDAQLKAKYTITP